MNTAQAMPRTVAESAFLAELLAETLGLADKIVGALEASRETPRNQAGLSPIRRAEIAADAKMRASVGAAMDREHARQMDEWRGLAAAKRAPLNKPASVANLKPAPFALTPAVVAKVIGLPGTARGSVDVPIAAVKLFDQPRASENPTRPSTWRKREVSANDAPSANDQVEAVSTTSSEPRLGSRAPAHLEEAQHCHSLTSADEHTEGVGAQQIASRSRHPVQKSGHDVDGARGGVSRSMPVPEASPPLFSQDAHERELRRIDARPPIKTSNNAGRRAAQRDAEQAKAARIEQIKASWAKVRARAAEETEL